MHCRAPGPAMEKTAAGMRCTSGTFRRRSTSFGRERHVNHCPLAHGRSAGLRPVKSGHTESAAPSSSGGCEVAEHGASQPGTARRPEPGKRILDDHAIGGDGLQRLRAPGCSLPGSGLQSGYVLRRHDQLEIPGQVPCAPARARFLGAVRPRRSPSGAPLRRTACTKSAAPGTIGMLAFTSRSHAAFFRRSRRRYWPRRRAIGLRVKL